MILPLGCLLRSHIQYQTIGVVHAASVAAAITGDK